MKFGNSGKCVDDACRQCAANVPMMYTCVDDMWMTYVCAVDVQMMSVFVDDVQTVYACADDMRTMCG